MFNGFLVRDAALQLLFKKLLIRDDHVFLETEIASPFLPLSKLVVN